MTDSRTAHWGAAVISGACIIAAALIGGAKYQEYRTARDVAQAEASQEDLAQQSQEQAQQIRRLTTKLSEQQEVIEALKRNLSQHPSSSAARTPQASETPHPQNQSAAEREAAAQPVYAAQSNGGLVVLPTSCVLTGTGLGCDFNVTNQRTDRRIALIGTGGPVPPPGFPSPAPSRLVTQNGTEIRARAVGLGSPKWETWWSESVLPQNVPMNAHIWFDGVPTDSTSVALVELTFKEGGVAFAVKFHDLPVTH